MKAIARLAVVVAVGFFAVGVAVAAPTGYAPGAYSTETLQPSATYSGPTVFAADQVNIRSGPGVQYDLIGVMIAGQTALAIGRSAGKDWIQISYPGGPGGIAWVYAPLVSLRAGTIDGLQIGEAPATATLPPTPSPEPGTALPATAVPTRLPTFTAAPAIVQPTFQTPELGGGGFPPALLIIGLFMVGVLAGAMVIVRQRG